MDETSCCCWKVAKCHGAFVEDGVLELPLFWHCATFHGHSAIAAHLQPLPPLSGCTFLTTARNAASTAESGLSLVTVTRTPCCWAKARRRETKALFARRTKEAAIGENLSTKLKIYLGQICQKRFARPCSA